MGVRLLTLIDAGLEPFSKILTPFSFFVYSAKSCNVFRALISKAGRKKR